MDFIDYQDFENSSSSPTKSRSNSELPAPAPPLILPINPDITNRFKQLKKKFDFSTTEPQENISHKDHDANRSSKAAQKYAQMSIELLDSTYEERVNNGLISDLPISSKNSDSQRPDVLLSTKLAKILNNYETNDHSLRDALNILQTKRELDLKVMIRSDLLGSISRRRFRSDIESELLKQHTSVLRDFQPVIDKIESLGDNLNNLNEISKKLNQFNKLDESILRNLKDLTNQKNLIILKKSLLNNFKKNFTLTQYEEHYLVNEDISLEYFEILTKCEKIHSNCSILLSLSNPKLGFKIMEKMNGFLELSYQRISYFLSNQLENFISSDNNSEGMLTTSSKELKLMKFSIFYLSKNLKFFDQIIDKLVSTRSKYIVDEFLYQLNNSDIDPMDNNSARPIVLSGHDPLRYIGDILAYIHSLIVNEIEFITGILKFDNEELINEKSSEFEQKLIQLENLQDLSKSIPSIVIKIIESLNKPLRVRIEQILRSEYKIDTLHKIFNLLDLYKMMYQKQLVLDSTILDNLESMKKLSIERIFTLLKEQIKVVENINDSKNWKIEDESLLPPEWLRGLLVESLVVFDSYVDTTTTILGLNKEEFKTLTSLMIDKPIELINKQYKQNFKEDKRSAKIYQLNCLDFIQSKILPITSLSTKVIELNEQLDKTKDELIQFQYESLLTNSGLMIHQQLIQLIFPIEQIETEDDYLMYSSLIENKLFNRENLQQIEFKIHEFLPIALIEVQQSLFKISSPSIVNDIIIKSSLKFINLYDVYYKILLILYEDEQFLEWNAFDIATLLGVEELYKNEILNKQPST